MPRPRQALDAVELTLYSELLAAVCAEMSVVLERSAYSPNIKERRDFSTALFLADGSLAAQGHGIPVHLGSMGLSVEAALAAVQARGRPQLAPGDVILLNDPYHGGTHLPDLTVVAPFYATAQDRVPLFYLADRAHHADVGGMSGGSLPLSRELYQEGLRLPPVWLVRAGELQTDIVELVCANSRTPQERRGDLQAQLAALIRGQRRLADLVVQVPPATAWRARCSTLQDHTAAAVRELLQSLPSGPETAVDWLELPDGSRAAIRLRLQLRAGRLGLDFRASDPQVPWPLNTVRALPLAASSYVLRTLLPAEVPTNGGLLRHVDVLTQPGTLVDARLPAAVAVGNTETSQRLVDVLFAALAQLLPERIPAASQGTMNNVLVSGLDPRSGQPFAYYETLGGGHGAGPASPGLSGRHSHMTNTLNTPIEALEHAYPLRIREYAVRRGSGGRGRNVGGAGLLREYEFLAPAQVSLLSQRRTTAPAGAAGAESGRPGRDTLISAARRRRIAGCAEFAVEAGDRLRIETPGGGGWGPA